VSSSPPGGHDHRVAVEDQLVLAADQIHVRDGGARLRRPALDQRQAYVVLVQLVRRRVDVDDEPDAGLAGGLERTAGLPEVLADGERHGPTPPNRTTVSDRPGSK
jgi:hypothetical protein